MARELQIVPHMTNDHQYLALDYVDALEPGYRFCPTDVELIVYYLKPKIESGKHPQCRIYEVNVYNCNPDELTSKECYRQCDGKWYFLTRRKPKYTNGSRVNRTIAVTDKKFAVWRSTQKETPVYDVSRQVVGTKRSLAFIDEHGRKTSWLMHEYTYTPKGIHANKLTDLVLCKIYKKESSQAINNYNQKDQQVENKRKLRDQEEAMQQQNQLHDHEHAPAKQQRVDQQVHHDHATNHHLGSNNVQEMGSMFQSNHVNNNIGSGMNAKFSVEALGGYNMDMNMINHMATPISMQPLVTFQDTNQGFTREEVQSLFGHSASTSGIEFSSDASRDQVFEEHDYEELMSLIEEGCQTGTDVFNLDELLASPLR